MSKKFYSARPPAGMPILAQKMLYRQAHRTLVARAGITAKAKRRAKNRVARKQRVLNRRKGVAS